MLCDIEGAEARLFDSDVVRRLVRTRVLIEVHEFKQRGISVALSRAFQSSHRAELIAQQPRDPAEFIELADLREKQRRYALSEHRPEELHWPYLAPVAA
jgi:hypothetical protein